MRASGWDQALLHPLPPTHVTVTDVREIAAEIWNEIAEECNMRKDVNISVDMDLHEDGVLAATRRTLVLNDQMWKPSVMFDYPWTDIEVHFNPDVPNGWHVDEGCSGAWRYDLRTVMRHELLHGAGLSSSIRPGNGAYRVGYGSRENTCYPTFYDTRLESNGVPVVDGCTYHPSGSEIYMAGRKIYVPRQYRSGSSFSHHAESGLFQWRMSPSMCHKLGDAEYDMLEGLGYDCTVGYTRSGQSRNRADLLLLMLIASATLSAGLVRPSASFSFLIAFLAFACASLGLHS